MYTWKVIWQKLKLLRIMMTSSNGNVFRVTGPLCGEFTGPGDFPTQRPVTRRFDVFSDLRLNKRLSEQPWGWWFETPSWSLWRQCNGYLETVSQMVYVIVKILSAHWSCKHNLHMARHLIQSISAYPDIKDPEISIDRRIWPGTGSLIRRSTLPYPNRNLGHQYGYRFAKFSSKYETLELTESWLPVVPL